jgi:hypothetical protein
MPTDNKHARIAGQLRQDADGVTLNAAPGDKWGFGYPAGGLFDLTIQQRQTFLMHPLAGRFREEFRGRIKGPGMDDPHGTVAGLRLA